MRVTTNPVNECPKGYPRLAALLDSDENFKVYRRFGFLQTRRLLYKQDQLRRLEIRLDQMDQYDEINNPLLLASREMDDADSGERRLLMEEIEKGFKEYCMVELRNNKAIDHGLMSCSEPSHCSTRPRCPGMSTRKRLPKRENVLRHQRTFGSKRVLHIPQGRYCIHQAWERDNMVGL